MGPLRSWWYRTGGLVLLLLFVPSLSLEEDRTRHSRVSLLLRRPTNPETGWADILLVSGEATPPNQREVPGHGAGMSLRHDKNDATPRPFLVHLLSIHSSIQNAVSDVLGVSSLHDYIPHNTYVVWGPEAVMARVAHVKGVLWVEELRSEHKIAPNLRKRRHRQQDDVVLTALLALGAEHSVTTMDDWLPPDVGTVRWAGSTQGRRLVVRVASDRVEDAIWQLAGRPEVVWVEERPRYHVLNKYANPLVQSGTSTRNTVHDAGIRGQGQIIGLGDTGIDYQMCFFNDGNKLAGPTHRKVISYNPGDADSSDFEDGHGTHVAGTLVGQAPEWADAVNGFNGIAPEAKIAFYDIDDGTTEYLKLPESLYDEYFPDAYNHGARIHSNSWGSDDPSYTIDAREVDEFMWDKDSALIVYANGNAGDTGWFSVGSPATCKNCLSIGASESSRDSFKHIGTVEALSQLSLKILRQSLETVSVTIGAFGRGLQETVEGDVALMDPRDGCSNALNPDELDGKVALIWRGSCPYTEKTRFAQDAGAVMVIITNNLEAQGPMRMGALEPQDEITIPALGAGFDDGESLRDILQSTGSLRVQATPGDIYLNPDVGPANLAGFSSRGPTLDMRIKPDVVAVGAWIESARSNAGVPTDGDHHCGPPGFLSSSAIFSLQGTSMACPVAAGSALLVRQYFVDGYYPTGVKNSSHAFTPSGALLRALMIHSTVPLTGKYFDQEAGYLNLDRVTPNYEQGYGRIQLDTALRLPSSSRGLWVSKDLETNLGDKGVRTGDVRRFCFNGAIEKATLAWTDAPATNLAFFALVNDLHLEVVTTDGSVFIGNGAMVEFDGEDIEKHFDDLNTVEQVVLPSEHQGPVTVLIQGPQRFALVVTGSDVEEMECSEDTPCPQGCSGHGSCVQGFCECQRGWGGDECTIGTTFMSVDAVNISSGSVKIGGWSYFSLEPSTLPNEFSVVVTVHSDPGDDNRIVAVAQSSARLPRLYDMDKNTPVCTQSCPLNLYKPEDAERGVYIGVYGYCCMSGVTFDIELRKGHIDTNGTNGTNFPIVVKVVPGVLLGVVLMIALAAAIKYGRQRRARHAFRHTPMVEEEEMVPLPSQQPSTDVQ